MPFWKNQFIDVIEWLDPTPDTIVYRFPDSDNEIKYGAQLTVRESQTAVFINEGQIADIFPPGRFELITGNMPILTNLKSWKHGFESPFKAEVYFINTRIFTDQKWGTPNPIMLRDQDFGVVRVRAFGNYAYRIGDPAKFLTEVVGTDGDFTTDKIANQLRSLIVTRFSDALGESKIPVLDMAANLDELSAFIRKQMLLDFDKYGVEIVEFLIQNVSLPPEVEEAMDKRSQMGVLGNLDQYTKFQAANAMEEAAKKGGGMSDAMNMGMGFAMANQFTQSQQPQQQQPTGSTPPPPPPQVQFHVYLNGQQMGPYGMPQLQQMVGSGQLTKEVLVWRDGMANWTAAGQVPELNNLFGATPPPPPPVS